MSTRNGRGEHFKEGNKRAAQNHQASGKLQHFLQSLACPLLAGGVLPPFLEVSCGVKTLDCGVGSEAAGRRQMNRNITIRPGERKRSSFGDHRLAADFICLSQWHVGAFDRVAEVASYLQWFLLLK